MTTNIRDYWNEIYIDKHVYGDKQSVSINLAISFLRTTKLLRRATHFFELGCGYGRDAFFIYQNLPDIIYSGVDVSNNGISSAIKKLGAKEPDHKISFLCFDIMTNPLQHIVSSANSYIIYAHYFLHLFPLSEREIIINSLNNNFPAGTIFIFSNYNLKNKRLLEYSFNGSFQEHSPPSMPKHNIYPFAEADVAFVSKRNNWKLLYKKEYNEIESVKNSIFNSESTLVIYEI